MAEKTRVLIVDDDVPFADSLSDILKELGLSHQKPETKAREQDEKEIKRWKRHSWPHIKKVRKA